MPSNNLFYYMKKVQLRAGLTVSPSFPSTPTDDQQLVLDMLNERLRYLNNKHYLSFKQTEFSFTTTAGTRSYDLRSAPYSETYFKVNRLARNGIIRSVDDIPLSFKDYTELDYLHPSTAANGQPRYYSVFGENLIIHPPPDGSGLKVRHYSKHIGTDVTGVTQKMRLSLETDLPMLDDEWEDALIVGAAMQVRGQQKVDEKYKELKTLWEDWETQLIDLGTQPGEDNGPEIVIQPYVYQDAAYRGKFAPFFTDVPGA